MPTAGAGRPLDVDRHRVAQHLAARAPRSAPGMVAEKSSVCRSRRAAAPGSRGCRAGSPCRACGRPRRAPAPRGRRAWRRDSACDRAAGPGVATRTSTPRRKAVLLRAHAHAAEDGGAADPRVAGELAAVLVDLRRQLARGGEDQGARGAAGLADAAGAGSAAGTPRSCRCRSWRRRARRGRPWPAGMASRWMGVGAWKPRSADAAEQIGMKLEFGEGHGASNLLRAQPGPYSLPRIS